MSDDITSGTYGITVEGDIANSLITTEDGSSNDQPAVADDAANGKEANEVVESQGEQQEPDQLEQPKDSSTVNDIELDGQTYTADELLQAVEAKKNESEWQRSNTQKSQKLSEDRKAFDKERSSWDDVLKDDDLVDTLKDYLGEDHVLFQERTVEPEQTEVSQDTKDTSTNDRIMELEGKIEQQEAERAVERDITALVKEHPELTDNEDAIRQVLQTAIDKDMTSLDDAFVLTFHQAAADTAFAKAVKNLENANSAKEVPEVNVTHKGEKSSVNKKPSNYDEARKMAFDYDLLN